MPGPEREARGNGRSGSSYGAGLGFEPDWLEPSWSLRGEIAERMEAREGGKGRGREGMEVGEEWRREGARINSKEEGWQKLAPTPSRIPRPFRTCLESPSRPQVPVAIRGGRWFSELALNGQGVGVPRSR